MITLYLVRHAEPQLGLIKDSICLGRKDLPLSHEGEKQAGRLAVYFKGKHLDAVFTSPLARSMKTASILAEKSGHKDIPLQIVPELAEVDTGHWDGMTFTEIREKYPDEYEERGRDIEGYVIPGGESLGQAGARMAGAVDHILKQELARLNTQDGNRETGYEANRNIVIVSHAGAMKTLLCQWEGKEIRRTFDYSLPYASVTMAEIYDVQDPDVPAAEKSGLAGQSYWRGFQIRLLTAGLRPVESISLSEVDRMWGACGVDMPLRRHMETVADTAMNLIGYDLSLVRSDWMDAAYPCCGSHINTRLVYFAALLHDIKRMEGGRVHPEKGAQYLDKEGYKELAELVRLHHDPRVFRKGQPLNEAELLYYADKLVQGDRLVSIEERFGESRKKCNSQEALDNHELRYQAALGIQKKI